jgi:hypothetical protein
MIQESKSNPGPFDPKPFLKTFSPALDQLLALRSQVAERTKKMETEVRRAEREYGRRLRELDGGFEVSALLMQLQIVADAIERNPWREADDRQLEAHSRTSRPRFQKSADHPSGLESNWNLYIKLDQLHNPPHFFSRII